ncbi:MAG: hypothetical protein IT342_26840 [Candidatus Melainabacteria bacterium]|nr:hypothetical protein [Candidatus Melainabacteria bacterium]
MIEAALGALILIPIALAIVDLITIVIANSMNDTAVKNCARAGANQPNGNAAQLAGEKALATFKQSGIVKSLVLDELTWAENGVCTAKTIMVVKMPVPLAGFSEMTFNGKATEPVVGTAPR